MKMSNWMGLGASVLLALGAGWWLGRSTAPPTEHAAGNAAAAPQGEPEILYYRNPMGLPDTSPVPKKDSMGMDYIPVYAGGEPPSVSGLQCCVWFSAVIGFSDGTCGGEYAF